MNIRKQETIIIGVAMMVANCALGAISEATMLRMAPMPMAPIVDGRISDDEAHSASVQYGAISQIDGLLTLRYAVFHFGYNERGIYFAARTSLPPSPMSLTDGDRVTLVLQSPNASAPIEFCVRTLDGAGTLPKGAQVKTAKLKGVTDYGVHCTETEMFIPYGETLPKVKDGDKWGLNMYVDFTSPNERGAWHFNPQAANELGALIADKQAVIMSYVHPSKGETYRFTGTYLPLFRFVNPTDRELPIAINGLFYRGLQVFKVGDDPDKVNGSVKHTMWCRQEQRVKAHDFTENWHDESGIWNGTINTMDFALKANGLECMRRKISWDRDKGRDWHDEEGLPSMRSAFFPSDGNRLRIEYNPNRKTNLVKAGVRVVDSKGEVHYKQAIGCAPTMKKGLIDIKLPNLPCEKYRVCFAAIDDAGRKYTDERTFEVAKFPWQQANVGKERIIIPPFKAIEVGKVKGDGGSDTISFLQTGYRCDGVLWGQMYGKDDELLAGPVRLILNGRDLTVIFSKFIERSPDRVVREVIAEQDGITLCVTQDYDYDGFCYVTMRFKASKPVEVDSLKVTIPLKDELAKLYQVMIRTDSRSGPAPDFTLPQGEGEVWTSSYRCKPKAFSSYPAPVQPYVFFGGTFKGVSVMAETIRDWSLEPGKDVQRIVRKNGAATLEWNFINQKTTWQGERTYALAFQPTPVKPQDWRLYGLAEHMYNYNQPTNAVGVSWRGGSLQISAIRGTINRYPNNDKSLLKWFFDENPPYDLKLFGKKVDEYVARNADWFKHSKDISAQSFKSRMHEKNTRMMAIRWHDFYMDPKLITCFWPEWEMYKADWYCTEWPWEDLYDEYSGRPSPTRVDKLLWDAKTALEDGFGGIYYDCFALQCDWNPCSSGGKAYFKPNGSVQRSLGNLTDWRSIMKRTATLCETKGKRIYSQPFVELHITDGFVIPVNSFGALGLATERSGAGGDFFERYPESYMLADVIGAQAGIVSRCIVRTTVGDKERCIRELRSLPGFMCAYGLFGLYDQGLYHSQQWFYQAWNVPFDYGWGKPEVTPHWFWDEQAQPVTHTGKDVRLTVAEKKGESALLMFGNLGEATTFAVDVAGLKLGNTKLVDAIDGSIVDPSKISIDRHGFRMIYVNRPSSKR